MPDDRSLDEFAVDSNDDADAGERDDTDGDHSTPNAERADVTPAVPTAAWTAEAAACDRCGEPVARRWFDDDALVCADCKEW